MGNNVREITLIEYWHIIYRRRKFICIFSFVSVLVSIVISLMMPLEYKAEATIMLLSGSKGGALGSLTSQFGGVASLAGIGNVGLSSPVKQLTKLFSSRTVAEYVIQHQNLLSVLFKQSENANMEAAVDRLKGHMKFVDDKDSDTIQISGEFQNQQIAADIVNTYIEGLQYLLNTKAFSVAKKNSLFIKEQIERNKEEMLEAGKELNSFYKRTSISAIESKIDVPIGVADININQGGVPDRVDFASFQSLLKQLTQQKDDLKNKLNTRYVENVPQQVYLEFLKLHRNLLVNIQMLLAQQYETSKIEALKDEMAFQVIDRAYAPAMKSKPKRTLIIVTVFSLSILIGIMWAFIDEYIEENKNKN